MKNCKQFEFDSILFRYTRIFNLLGESCVISSDIQSSNSISTRLIRYFPPFMSLMITVCLTISEVFLQLNNFESSQRITSAIYVIFFLSVIATKLIGIIQMHTLANTLPQLFTQFKELIYMTESKYKWNSCKFHRYFVHEVAIIFGAWIITCSFNTLIKHEFESEFWANICVYSVIFINRITMCHVHFYVVLFRNFIDFYVDYMRQKAVGHNPKAICDLKIELIFLKIAHFKLHEISNAINTIFGWVFVSIFVQEFVDIIYQIYWIFLLTDCTTIYETIRN